MDRRTFVKASCLGSAGLFLGFDPNAPGQENVTLPEPPPIEVHGLPRVKHSPLGMPGLFPGRVVELSDPKSIVRNRVSQPIVGPHDRARDEGPDRPRVAACGMVQVR